MNDLTNGMRNDKSGVDDIETDIPKPADQDAQIKKGGARTVVIAVVILAVVGLALIGLLTRNRTKKEVYETASAQQQQADAQRLAQQEKTLSNSFENLNLGEHSPAPIAKRRGRGVQTTPFDVEETPPATAPPAVDNTVKLPEALTQPLVDEAAEREKRLMEERLAKLEQELKSQKEENDRLRAEQEALSKQPPPQPVMVETKPAAPPPPPRSSIFFNNDVYEATVSAPAAGTPPPPAAPAPAPTPTTPTAERTRTERTPAEIPVVKRAPFGTMIPIRLLGTVASNTLNGSYVRCEVTRDVQGRDWRIPRGTQLIGEAASNAENRVFVNFIGYIDPKLNRLVKLKCQAVGSDGQNGFPAKVKYLDSRVNYVLNRLFNTATFLAQASLSRGRGFVVLPNTGDISILTGVPLTPGAAGFGGGGSLRTYIKVPANTEGFALVTDMPESVETVDADGIETANVNIGGAGEQLRRILDGEAEPVAPSGPGRRGGPNWNDTPGGRRGATRGPRWDGDDAAIAPAEATECDCASVVGQSPQTGTAPEEALLDVILAHAGRRRDDGVARELARRELRNAGVFSPQVVELWGQALQERRREQEENAAQPGKFMPSPEFVHLKSYEQIMLELRQKEAGFFIFKQTLASRMQPRIVIAVLVTACAVLRFDPLVCNVLINQVPRVINQNDRDGVNRVEYQKTIEAVKARLAERGELP